jgi:hypothetical protein
MRKTKVFILIAIIIVVISMRKKIVTTVGAVLTRGMRNNNPFNLRFSFSKWQGLVGKDDKGFCIFDSLEHGVRAGIINLRNGYFNQKLTIQLLVSKYAPAFENNVQNYVSHLCSYSNVFNPDYIPCNLADYVLICKGIVRMEQGFDAVDEDLIVKYLNG